MSPSDIKTALGHIAAFIEDERNVPVCEAKPQERKEVIPLSFAELEKQAMLVEEFSAAACLATSIGAEFRGLVGPAGFKRYRDRLLEQSGNPTDPMEIMLVEQLALANHQVGFLFVKAIGAKSHEEAPLSYSAAGRLMAEFRRSALALETYREQRRQSPAKSPAKRPRKSRAADSGEHQGNTDNACAEKVLSNSKLGSNGTNGHANGHSKPKVPKSPTGRRWKEESFEARPAERGGPSAPAGSGVEEPTMEELDWAAKR